MVVNKNSAGDIWVELDRAVAQNKPIVIFNWSPKLKFEKGLKKTINHYKKNDKIS